MSSESLLSSLSSVAIVGPSAHLVGMGLGRRIDSHEAVLRVNELGPSGQQSDFGSRTDIMFHSFGPGTAELLISEAWDYRSRAGNPVTIICPRDSTQIDEEFANLSEISGRLPEGFSLEVLSHSFFRTLFPGALKSPTTGALAIIELVSRVEKVFICGFNFFSARQTYHAETLNRRKEWGFGGNHVSGHDTKAEVSFLKDFLENSGVDSDAVFKNLVIGGNYKGKQPLLFARQVIRNSLRGLRSRF